MKSILTIYKKELRDSLRDKRTRNNAFFMPGILIIVMLIGFGSLDASLSKPSSQKIYVIAGQEKSPFATALAASGVKIATVANVDEGEAKIKKGDIRLLLSVPPSISQTALTGGAIPITAYYDPNDQGASIPLSIVQQSVSEMNKGIISQIFVQKGLPQSLSQPIVLKDVKVKTGSGGASDLLIQLLPYLIVIWAFYGGMGVVGDLVAGEKEKSTLETLLISPATRREIALGKLFALCTICASSSISSVLGVIITSQLHLSMTKDLFAKGLGLSPVGTLVILLVLLPLVFVFGNLMLAMSTIAKNMRECYSSLAIVSFVVLIPAIFSQFIGLTGYARALWVNFVPVLNTASTIRLSMLGIYDPAAIAITVGVEVVLGIGLLLFTTSLFEKERVLLRS